jgi:hypothetical protein
MTDAPKGLRLVSLLLFLTVFFLPLHFHPVAATVHVAKECSCIHGTRTEMAMAPAQVDWALALSQYFYHSFRPRLFSSLIDTLQLIRAPPAL